MVRLIVEFKGILCVGIGCFFWLILVKFLLVVGVVLFLIWGVFSVVKDLILVVVIFILLIGRECLLLNFKVWFLVLVWFGLWIICEDFVFVFVVCVYCVVSNEVFIEILIIGICINFIEGIKIFFLMLLNGCKWIVKLFVNVCG